LNSMLWERCLAMAFILRKPSYKVNSLGPNCPASGAHPSSTANRDQFAYGKPMVSGWRKALLDFAPLANWFRDPMLKV
jgi:hypothetical protein